MAKSIDITVPDLGDFSDVEIIEVLVSEGDSVSAEDGLITLETDKAAMDVPAPKDGRIESLSVSVGDRVSAGDVIGKMAVDDGGDTVVIPPPGKSSGKSEGDEDDEKDAEHEEDEKDEKDEKDDETSADKQKKSAEDDAGGSSEDGDEDKDAQERKTLSVPELGDFDAVEIIEVHVSEGDTVDVEDPLITLETDKAAMDVPSTDAGKIVEVRVSVGDKVSEGDAVAVIETKGSSKSSSEASKSSEKASGPDEKKDKEPEREADSSAEKRSSGDKTQKPSPQPEAARAVKHAAIDEAGFARAHASPSVRKLARELGVDLTRVKGSGKKSRILHDDVKAFVKSVLAGGAAVAGTQATLPKTPSVDFSKFGEIELEPLTRIQKISGPRLQASWINLPHVTQHDEADITDLEARRQELKGPAKERGIPLTPLAFIMKACVAALKEFPKVNSSLSEDGENLVMKKYCHIGFAADTEQGLVVPVIRDADKKDVYELAKELAELSALAREGKLKAPQLQGASFTISSLGGIGGTAFTPIVNAPEVGILGVSRSSMKPVWNGEKFEPRLILPYALSYDHRVVDGALAVRFTTFLAEKLGEVDELLQAIP